MEQSLWTQICDVSGAASKPKCRSVGDVAVAATGRGYRRPEPRQTASMWQTTDRVILQLGCRRWKSRWSRQDQAAVCFQRVRRFALPLELHNDDTSAEISLGAHPVTMQMQMVGDDGLIDWLNVSLEAIIPSRVQPVVVTQVE